jgi:hypothetical protein
VFVSSKNPQIHMKFAASLMSLFCVVARTNDGYVCTFQNENSC